MIKAAPIRGDRPNNARTNLNTFRTHDWDVVLQINANKRNHYPV